MGEVTGKSGSSTGEIAKPHHLWRGANSGILPVFFNSKVRLGVGRGRKAVSQTLRKGLEEKTIHPRGL